VLHNVSHEWRVVPVEKQDFCRKASYCCSGLYLFCRKGKAKKKKKKRKISLVKNKEDGIILHLRSIEQEKTCILVKKKSSIT
jgi:hypothetical protein